MVTKIGWLQSDIGIQGGAEMSCGALMSNAPEWVEGYICPPTKRPPRDLDAFIIQNSTTYTQRWIEELALKPIIRHVRDPWFAGDAVLRRWILDYAALLIFSSPPQVEAFAYPFDAPYVVLPVPVDLRAFKDAAKPAEERKGTVFVGRVDIYKGAHRVIDWALRTGEALKVVGDNRYMSFGDLPEHIEFVGQVGYKEMPELLGAAKRYIAFPEWPEAFGRSVAEAWAAGCELLIEGRVGAQWWIDNEPERIGFDGPIAEFWAAIEEVLL